MKDQPQGKDFSLIASSSETKRDQLIKSSTDTIKITEHIGREKTFKHCKHRSREAKISVYGEEIQTTGIDCPDCLIGTFEESVIRCCLCGLPIVPGQPVALYWEGPQINKKIATKLKDGHSLGCLRWDCCPSGGFFAGHWNEKGFLPNDWDKKRKSEDDVDKDIIKAQRPDSLQHSGRKPPPPPERKKSLIDILIGFFTSKSTTHE